MKWFPATISHHECLRSSSYLKRSELWYCGRVICMLGSYKCAQICGVLNSLQVQPYHSSVQKNRCETYFSEGDLEGLVQLACTGAVTVVCMA